MRGWWQGMGNTECPKCGYLMSPLDDECPRCKRMARQMKAGPRPVGQRTSCPRCGKKAHPEDTYCAGCGASLGEQQEAAAKATPGPLVKDASKRDDAPGPTDFASFHCPHCETVVPLDPRGRPGESYVCGACGGEFTIPASHAPSTGADALPVVPKITDIRVIVAVVAGLLLLALVVAAFAQWLFGGVVTHGYRTTCQDNERSLAFAMLMYVQDYDERFPPHWAWREAVRPYTLSAGAFTCPASRSDGSSYAMNNYLGLSGAGGLLPGYRNRVLIYDADEDRSVAYRHGRGANIAHLDGHVKWYRKSDVDKLDW